jgi:DNA modification methylase
LVGKPYTGFESTTGKTVGKVNGSAKSVHYANEGTRYQSSILDFARAYGLHPTQKPLGLFRSLVRMFSNEGDTVFDGFAGSGTTAVACLHENRQYVCCEKDATYFTNTQERIAKFSK